MLRFLAPLAAVVLVAAPALAQDNAMAMGSNTTKTKKTMHHMTKKPMHKKMTTKKTSTTAKTSM